jgi:hypothetical protein
MDALVTKLRYRFFNGSKIRMVNTDEDKIRGKEVFLFIRELSLYKVKLSRLVNSNQKEASKNLCLNIAYYIIESTDDYDLLRKKRELPISNICRETGVSRTFVELWGDFIIAYTLILANPNYRFIQEYINIVEYDKQGIVQAEGDKKLHKGIILRKERKNSIILTCDGSFIKIKTNESVKLGEEKEGYESKSIKHYRKQIAIILTIIIALSGVLYYKYNKITSIIIINTTSLIKVEINSFNKVVYSYSPTEKGADLLDEANVENTDIDDALKKILALAYEKKMLVNNSVTIFINQQAISYDSIKETEKYLIEKNIDTSINNVGYEHKVRKDKDNHESEKSEEQQKTSTEKK